MVSSLVGSRGFFFFLSTLLGLIFLPFGRCIFICAIVRFQASSCKKDTWSKNPREHNANSRGVIPQNSEGLRPNCPNPVSIIESQVTPLPGLPGFPTLPHHQIVQRRLLIVQRTYLFHQAYQHHRTYRRKFR